MKKIIALILAALFAVTLAACGEKTKSTDLTQVMSEMDQKGFTKNMIDLTKEDLFDYYGIVEEDVVQFAAKINDSGVKTDELVMIEAKDGDAAARIKERLDARYSAKVNENASYNVEELAVVKKCKVEVKGNYVSMLVSSSVEEVEGVYNNSFK